ncbi:Glycosyl transferase, group 1 family protein [hydrothermal vent metagenome]|uniref:Glycosyl transferase, group 1 family protein n=1 Tax=hydrothermal vent metagenome TaxID=652676 RepID=A0A3B0S7Z1_9ZZZZ
MKNTIAVILKGYPRLSETFIAQELRGLEKAGFSLRLISMRHPTDKHTHPVHDEIVAPVSYLPEYLHNEPLRVLKGWWQARKRKGYAAARRQFLQDLKGEFTRNRFRRFGQALVLASELPTDVSHLHAHFLHTPASVAFYTSTITGLPYTCSAHAKDIWTSSDEDLRGKLNTAKWVVTCTKNGWKHLQGLAKDPDRVHLSYHGLDLSRFASPGRKKDKKNGTNNTDPVVFVTVSRAVEKKGLDTLLDAFALLPAGLNWRWVHIGAGDLVKELQKQAKALGLEHQLEWRGALPQTDVLEQYRQSDIFVLPCRIASNGDRDGLPNVIVEAQSQCLPVISTTVSGVPELVDDGKNGLLVDQNDSRQLAAAIEKLLKNPALRHKMGKAGEKRVRGDFDHVTSISYLGDLFQQQGVAAKETAK